MKVDKKTFYHIHTKIPNDTWRPGGTLKFDKTKHNFFMERLKESCSTFFQDSYRKDFALLKDFVEMSGQLMQHIDLEPDLASQNRQLRQALSVSLRLHETGANYLAYYIKHLREIIFEQIRAEHYPDKPSRMHGIWLCTEEEIENWHKILGKDGETEIYQVKATGIIHEANATMILADSLTISEYEFLAKCYWNEVPYTTELCTESEILFEGELEIIGLHT